MNCGQHRTKVLSHRNKTTFEDFECQTFTGDSISKPVFLLLLKDLIVIQLNERTKALHIFM